MRLKDLTTKELETRKTQVLNQMKALENSVSFNNEDQSILTNFYQKRLTKLTSIINLKKEIS